MTLGEALPTRTAADNIFKIYKILQICGFKRSSYYQTQNLSTEFFCITDVLTFLLFILLVSFQVMRSLSVLYDNKFLTLYWSRFWRMSGQPSREALSLTWLHAQRLMNLYTRLAMAILKGIIINIQASMAFIRLMVDLFPGFDWTIGTPLFWGCRTGNMMGFQMPMLSGASDGHGLQLIQRR
ncbi:hypothetical protein C2S52_012537 [Perilla frutescens var. hirtella]|uniref:Uncharacterized protein n=1 Tax=Perilla frutescens var. hirtella TaxID=608512 RepID=A0AAD4J106_PERFH|nr:hypothetical protein C2S52_012537 [Perilla frutescens var. hirtella]KAH6825215.1 hypothetical protein C2S53_018762 [Perilla frutescens var. hirtella]